MTQIVDKLTRLARAEKDEKPVHDLMIKCRRCDRGLIELDRGQSSDYTGCSNCGGKSVGYCITSRSKVPPEYWGTGFVPNTDPMALIAACDTVKFDKYCDGWQCWIVIEDNDWTAEGYGTGERGDQSTMIKDALINAMVQATAPLVDNWVECPGDVDDGCPYSHEDNMEGMGTCPPCAGTGYVEAVRK